MIRAYTVLILLAALYCAPARAIVTFDWATIGNPGNADDDTGYGGVDYTYRISKFEVTAGQYTNFLNAVAASDPYGLYNARMWSDYKGCKIEQLGSDGSYTYQVAADRENRPVNYVSFFDSMRFTNWLHNGQGNGSTETGAYNISDDMSATRSTDSKYWIPSEDEWYKAAYHKNDGVTDNYFALPTSSDQAPGFVDSFDNLSPAGIPFVEGGTDPGNYATYDFLGNHDGIGSPYFMTEVGEWEKSASPYGTFDQGGNVWEWNDTVVDYPFRGLRGGAYFYSLKYLTANQRDSVHPLGETNFDGFRVASVPEPSSVLLGALVAAGVILHRLD